MVISLTAVAVNVALKFALVDSFGVMGLALATALGASLNLALLIWIADGRGWMAPDGQLMRAIGAAAAGSLALALLLIATSAPLAQMLAGVRFSPEIRLVAQALAGAVAYGGAAFAVARLTGLELRR